MTAFAILCHGEPKRLSYLLEALAGSEIFIHIDRFADRKEILSAIQNNDLQKVNIIPETKSIRGSWGGYSIVEIQLKLIREFVSQSHYEGPLVFLSGQDFPIKPLTEFAEYLKTKENFFSIQILDYAKVDSGDLYEISRLERIQNLHIQDFRFFRHCKDREKWRYKFGSLPSAVVRKMKITNPNFKRTKNFYIGSQWVAISSRLCELILENEEALRSEFRFTFCPDELAFQSMYGRMQLESTMVKSVEKSKFDSVIDADFHLIHSSLNHAWNLSDFDSIVASNKFFIRKPSWDLLMKLHQLRLAE